MKIKELIYNEEGIATTCCIGWTTIGGTVISIIGGCLSLPIIAPLLGGIGHSLRMVKSGISGSGVII